MARQLTIRQKIAKLEKEANSLYFNSHKSGNISPEQLKRYEMQQQIKYNKIQQEITKLRQEYQILVNQANQLQVAINQMDLQINQMRAQGANIGSYTKERTKMLNKYQSIRRQLM